MGNGIMGTIPTYVNGLKYTIISELRPLGLNTKDILQFLKQYNVKNHQQICFLFKLIGVNHEFKYMSKIFSAFRENQMSDIFQDFRDYVLSLYHFCTLSERRTIKFGLDLYGVHQSHKIDVYCLISLIKDIYGYEYPNNEYANNIIEKLEKFRDKQLESKVINGIIPSMKQLFAPVLRVQGNAIKETLTKDRWKELRDIRASLDDTITLAYFQKINPNFCKPGPRAELESDMGDTETAKPSCTRLKRIGSERANRIQKVDAFQISKANAKRRVLELQKQKQTTQTTTTTASLQNNSKGSGISTTSSPSQSIQPSTSKRLLMSFRTQIMRRLEEEMIDKEFTDVSGYVHDSQPQDIPSIISNKAVVTHVGSTNLSLDVMQNQVDRIITHHPPSSTKSQTVKKSLQIPTHSSGVTGTTTTTTTTTTMSSTTAVATKLSSKFKEEDEEEELLDDC